MAPLQSNWAISKRKDNQNTSRNYLPAQNACETLAKWPVGKRARTSLANPRCQTAFLSPQVSVLPLGWSFPFAFRKTLIESKYKHILPPHGRASRRARITRLTDFDWHSHSRNQSVFPVHQRTDYSKMLVCGQAVFLVPSPTPFPPIFLLLLNLFNMASEIEFASSNFPPSHKTASYAGYGVTTSAFPFSFTNFLP